MSADEEVTPQFLEAAWHETAARAGLAASDAEAVFQDLCRRYSEPGRAYHNLDHIAAMLDTVSRFEQELHNTLAVCLAIWFHDAVYDTRRNDNEEQSSFYANEALQRGVETPLKARVRVLINATKTHQAPPSDTDCQLLLDTDLAVLGASAEDYDRYARAIREEYAWVLDGDYRAGRCRVLEGFLKRDRLFFTPPLFDGLEQPARANLRREIEQLTDFQP